MRRAMCTAVVIVGLLGSALAQNNNNSGTNTGIKKYEAPIGHRQPTLKSLPPDVLQNEPKSAPGEREYDKKLIICRRC
jgi:hypothetical protein